MRLAATLVASGAALAACGGRAGLSAPPSSTLFATPPTTVAAAGPLTAPHTSAIADADYLNDVAQADPTLATYVTERGSVALRALLTDGSAFCAFLARGGGIDQAMASLALGASGVEKSTRLPSTVTTFNTIAATSLLTLCPSELSLVPAADQTRIRALGTALGAALGTALGAALGVAISS